ncbi:MAG: protein-export chaperone SecB [Candidatus Electrothrix sp. Rat3]|nr:protein-export chaperone SecB [Candidatus Electrothrix rattekaaiensis]
MSATNTPLRLNNYFFPVVQVVANPKYRNAEEQPEPRFRITPSIAKNDENGLYQVSVDIHLLQEDEKVPVPYSIHLVAFGFFEVHPEWPEPEKLLFINGSTILYAAAREYLITVSSRGPWGAATLPMVSFLNMYQETVKEHGPTADTQKKQGEE